ncbi:MAG: NAD(P)(+) transhydrogenase (Re/Si-specific) subunit beta [Candidatus Promineifilaceae bacterium]
METLIDFFYIISAILFVYGIKMLGSAETAVRGNRLSSLGMLVAVIVTLVNSQVFTSWYWIAGGLLLGGAIGAAAASRVEMTGMPELVALFNGTGGLASLLVGLAEHAKSAESMDNFTQIVVFVTILIGAITFTGSIYAWGKLSGKLDGQAKLFAGQQPLNFTIFAAIVVLAILYAVFPAGASAVLPVLIAGTVLSLALGWLGVMPIGGGDMPVVVSLLNSCSGLAAAAAGFVIQNTVLIVAGCLVGASGLILTIIMCKAMNRTLANVLFSGFGATAASDGEQEGEMKPASVEDAYYVLEAASSVVIVPGYGMAMAQAQHVVKELGVLLENNGAEVRFCVHPVAGRMPGHMNVLLAEADVAYEQLVEMDDVNPTMGAVDVAIIIGANDVVNPSALDDEGSPLYGMPIIRAHEANTVYALKRGKGRGFSGVVNPLFLAENTRMLFGDAKATIGALVTEFKEGA